MIWQTELLARLAIQPCVGYGSADSAATEPSSLAALALSAAGRDECAHVGDWLAGFQSDDGSVGVRPSVREPAWTTSLAVLVWNALRAGGRPQFDAPLQRAVQWIVADHGLAMPRTPESGHDSTLDAWSWVPETHSWVEPTAFHVLALKAAGCENHPRTRSAVAMLLDRQLPRGGFNYGNTIVLGNELRPHVQPTAIALLALADDKRATRQLGPSYAFLRSQLSPGLSTVSLCFSLLALAVYGELTEEADRWLEAAYHRVIRTDRSPYKLALLAVAACRSRHPLLPPRVPQIHSPSDTASAAGSGS